MMIATSLLFVVCWLFEPYNADIPCDEQMPRLTTGTDICDYRVFIKKCLAEPKHYRPVNMASHDACYPALSYCLIRPFYPSAQGEKLYVATLYAGLLAGFMLFLAKMPRKGGSGWWLPVSWVLLSH